MALIATQLLRARTRFPAHGRVGCWRAWHTPTTPTAIDVGQPGATQGGPAIGPARIDAGAVADELGVDLGCTMVASLLKERVCRDLRMTQPWRYEQGRKAVYDAFSGDGEVRRMVDMTKPFHSIHAFHLLSVVLYLWGLSIPLRDSDPLALLVIVGSGATSDTSQDSSQGDGKERIVNENTFQPLFTLFLIYPLCLFWLYFAEHQSSPSGFYFFALRKYVRHVEYGLIIHAAHVVFVGKYCAL